MNYKVDIDEHSSEQEKLIIYSIERLRLSRQIENYILRDGDGIIDSVIESTKQKIKHEFYSLLEDFITVESNCGRFGASFYTAKLDLPYIKDNVMKRLENENEILKALNDSLCLKVGEYESMTGWQHFKRIFIKI